MAISKIDNNALGTITSIDTGSATSLSLKTNGVTGLTIDASQNVTMAGLLTASFLKGMFKKDNSNAVSFVTTGAFSVSTQTQMYIEVNNTCLTIASGTVVSMPSPVVGTDYAIWVATNGTLSATSNHTTPPSTNGRKIGGFHYAPGGNATAQSGGNNTPYINDYSFWDLNWRFNGIDNRGMTLVGGKFWADIYLLNADYTTNGTSKYNATIADGSSPPIISPFAGGNGSTRYGSFNWWEASEVASWAGKRLPTYQEFSTLAYGTTENSSLGTDPVSTVLNASYMSKWGCNQSSGVLWQWGADFGGSYTATAWVNNNGGRGQPYNLSNAVIFGGSLYEPPYSGSRCSSWNILPSFSASHVGARCVGDHLRLV